MAIFDDYSNLFANNTSLMNQNTSPNSGFNLGNYASPSSFQNPGQFDFSGGFIPKTSEPSGWGKYLNRDFMMGKQGQMGFLPMLGGLGSGLSNLYAGQKQYNLMNDALDWNKSMSQTNLDNQTKLVNNQIYDEMWRKLNSTGKYGKTPEEQARLEADTQAAIASRTI